MTFTGDLQITHVQDRIVRRLRTNCRTRRRGPIDLGDFLQPVTQLLEPRLHPAGEDHGVRVPGFGLACGNPGHRELEETVRQTCRRFEVVAQHLTERDPVPGTEHRTDDRSIDLGDRRCVDVEASAVSLVGRGAEFGNVSVHGALASRGHAINRPNDIPFGCVMMSRLPG